MIILGLQSQIFIFQLEYKALKSTVVQVILKDSFILREGLMFNLATKIPVKMPTFH